MMLIEFMECFRGEHEECPGMLPDDKLGMVMCTCRCHEDVSEEGDDGN